MKFANIIYFALSTLCLTVAALPTNETSVDSSIKVQAADLNRPSCISESRALSECLRRCRRKDKDNCKDRCRDERDRLTDCQNGN
ncbi:hypothetical protein HDV05_006820 [Chytridiales sp. JEL 0842]|nr:hypothetical protein HDV05_006820 [Chytridiales sp. JEL 0842]